MKFTGKSIKNIEILDHPKEYLVKFTFPDPTLLNPPILDIYDITFGSKSASTI